MVAEPIDIIVSERGSRTVRRNLEGIGQGAQQSEGAVQLLRRALATLGGALAVRELIQLADTFTNIQNRLRTVTSGTAELSLVTDELFGVAQRTRTSFEGTAEVYARVGLAARELGVAQSQLLEFTESLNQAVVLSGASATEAQAGLIQLSQGLASGALRGDELRSVLEQLPVVADVIAQSLGVTRGELRELGAEGRITADIVLTAFAEAREELANRFGETVPTVSQSFTVLRDSVLRFIGTLDASTGLTGVLSQGLITLADNVDTLARAFGAAALTIGVIFGRQAIGSAITGLRALGVAIATNPLGALALALTAATAALATFSDQITIAEGSLTTLSDLGTAAFEALGSAFSSLAALFQDETQTIQDGFEDATSGISISIEGIVLSAARGVDNIVRLFSGLRSALGAAFDEFPAVLEASLVTAFNGASRLITAFVNGAIDIINELRQSVGLETLDAFEAFQLQLSDNAREGARNVGRAFLEGLGEGAGAVEAVERLLTRAGEITEERLEAQLARQRELAQAQQGLTQAGAAPGRVDSEFQELIQGLEEENRLLTLNNRERTIAQGLLDAERDLKRDLTAAERDQVEALLEQNLALQEQSDLLEEIRGPAEELERRQQTLQTLFEQGRITLEEYNNELRDTRLAALELNTDAASGVERFFLRLEENAADAASQVESLLTDAFQSAEDAFVEFTQTGRLNFESFISDIQEQLTRLAFQQATAQLAGGLGFGGGGGGGGGGLFSSLFGGGGGGGLFSGLLGFQNGGSFGVGPGTSPSLGGVDNRLVAFRARDGEQVTVTPPGQSDNRSMSVIFNISTPDANSFQRSQKQILADTNLALNGAGRSNN